MEKGKVLFYALHNVPPVCPRQHKGQRCLIWGVRLLSKPCWDWVMMSQIVQCSLEPNNVREMEGKEKWLQPPQFPPLLQLESGSNACARSRLPPWRHKCSWGDNSPLEDCLVPGKGSLETVLHFFLLLEAQEKMLQTVSSELRKD